jgi:hypothetical protein
MAARDIFDRLEPPAPAEATSEHEKSQSIERLLSWLLNNWTKDTITGRQLRYYGPYPLRNEKKATLNLMQELADRGWVFQIPLRRRDARKWKIGRPTT